MSYLENLEKGTPEFQSLTEEQQNKRRKLLVIMLHKVLNEPSSLGFTQQEVVPFTYGLLELYLTRKIERFTETEKNKKLKK